LIIIFAYILTIYFRWTAKEQCSFLELRTYRVTETEEGEEKEVDATFHLSLEEVRRLLLSKKVLVR